jgi:hypothetical protein
MAKEKDMLRQKEWQKEKEGSSSGTVEAGDEVKGYKRLKEWQGNKGLNKG